MERTTCFFKNNLSKKRIACSCLLWALVLVLCLLFSHLTLLSCKNIVPEKNNVYLRPWGEECITLAPNQIIRLDFTATNIINGSVQTICLDLENIENPSHSFSLRILSTKEGRVLAEYHSDPADFDFQKKAAGNAEHYSHWITFSEPVSFINSENYAIEITNDELKAPLLLRYNPVIKNGFLSIDGKHQNGFLNIFLECSTAYQPSLILVKSMTAVTVITAMAGITLVLFSNIKTQHLYLLLAVGFGIVTLFDLTPIYGFDMGFHFDSTYVVSNRILRMEQEQFLPSLSDSEKDSVFYQRRICDDYSSYQFYHDTDVSINYMDNRDGLTEWSVDPSKQELVFSESYQGAIGEQLYLYLPQGLGFALARLLGLGMFPMLLLGRLFAYSLFVFTLYKSIARLPFGKNLMLIFGICPSVLVQTVSITRDVMILTMAVFLISTVLNTAYKTDKPTFLDWAGILIVSVLLAPCKMIYLPLSFFWLLIIYRKNILEQKQAWYKIMLQIFLLSIPILIFFISSNLSSIGRLSQVEKLGLDQEPARTLSIILQDPSYALFIFLNTIRTELGTYFINALQLYEIELGSTHTISLLLTVLLCLASCESGKKINNIRPLDRFFFFFVSLSVFLLAALASMQWTPLNYDVILGLQGRYLLPVFPLIFLIPANNKMIQIRSDLCNLVIGFGCCIIPAISLMNMYLWTIAT